MMQDKGRGGALTVRGSMAIEWLKSICWIHKIHKGGWHTVHN